MENVVKKLLESNEPSIRLRTRIEVLGESIDSRISREIQEEVKRSERVRLLFYQSARTAFCLGILMPNGTAHTGFFRL